MKKRNFLAALLLLWAGLQTAWAQKVVLRLTNNEVLKYSVEQVESITFEQEDDDDNPELHEYVDLGLPSGTLWATCNVGATQPEESGDYFAWGETQPKENYSRETYKYCKGTEYYTMTKYCTDSYYGTVDNKTELESMDDAATANWGSEWQMPSYEQCRELINSEYTIITWTTQNGVYGMKIVSKQNGNSIFLPAAGCRYVTYPNDVGSYGNYWSRSLHTSFSYYGRSLYFDLSGIYTNDCDRFYGQSVRPVRVKK